MDELLLKQLAAILEGELYWDQKMRILYATDASAYRELPLAVAIPRSVTDLSNLIAFAAEHGTSLIPRAAGTSLAGQVVGHGIVVDISRHFTNILELNVSEKWVRVQPGVIRDELNSFLHPHGLYFGPETSTANRAMIGGMVGNNSCGSNSLIYRSTREHCLEIDALLSDGSAVTFKALSFDAFCEKCEQKDLEGRVYREIRSMLGDYQNQEHIRREFPKPTIDRRNTGYALDMLLDSDPFTAGTEPFNFCKLLCGSEGTLAFITSIKLNLVDRPVKPSGLLCIHFADVAQALAANLIALEHKPLVSELMDHYILECTKNNIQQAQNSFFVEGDPGAILVVEYDGDDIADIKRKVALVEADMRAQGLGYSFPLVLGSDKKRVWDLRKAGLGLLSNTPGDNKPVAVIEDTAVDVRDLPAYIAEFNKILAEQGLYSVHYAHAATGELHLRPIINLKTKEGNAQFRLIATQIAQLVKRYGGSLSGEHGDGRLRGEFIALMLGEHNYKLLKDIKRTWDPKGIFNPGKIVDTAPMNSSLRYDPEKPARAIKSVFRYNGQSILQHAEQCNGSGDCRKTELSGGTMCPSYMATRNEQDTTRARANMLREMLTTSTERNPFDHEEIKEVMDLCLSCKGCKSECPSSVDMAKLKADFLQAYYDSNGVPFRSWIIGHVDQMTMLVSHFPKLYNWAVGNSWTSGVMKRILGFASERSIPTVGEVSLRKWFTDRAQLNSRDKPNRQVYFFFDEFTNYNDVEVGKKAILLLERLGYQVLNVPHAFSGRGLLSKGFLREARKLANANVRRFAKLLNEEVCLVAVEPSTILTFRDEYVDLVQEDLIEEAKYTAKYALTIEEFLVREKRAGRIGPEQFTNQEKEVLLHTHCQQKAWGLQPDVAEVLAIPSGYSVKNIPSGCCGMAGSFGYEEEHYKISQDIGELVLFPAIRAKAEGVVVAAPGASCRHQIQDGVQERAYHPVEILYDALKT
ncbi:FAD-binding oxidoreductase [Sphingobacterium psychroaquaticum]|uniref:FAD-binding and (Fe-S)-binding domain-containing protein n=1 Tax=Sphingobacterium psychroaquaticum TaxID=561061 RepID=UPI001069E781|nr:FAD-binding and (Fe-S)-binding domain-containing protein [Sphingobacterium psychroaquaticum]QBQ39762.1 FAD-binding oxidoreductase [Sphingobacterium psychroaquaticum]